MSKQFTDDYFDQDDFISKGELVQLSESQGRRIAELEAQVAALTPKPTVTSSWRNLYNNFAVYHTEQDTIKARCSGFIGTVRVDKITHPDGKVEYMMEIER